MHGKRVISVIVALRTILYRVDRAGLYILAGNDEPIAAAGRQWRTLRMKLSPFRPKERRAFNERLHRQDGLLWCHDIRERRT